MKKLAKILSLTLALVMCAAFLTACGATADSTKKKYEDAGYNVSTLTKENLSQYNVNVEESDFEWGVIANKNLSVAIVICFKDAKKAEEVKGNLPSLFKSKLEGKVLTLATTDNALEAK